MTDHVQVQTKMFIAVAHMVVMDGKCQIKKNNVKCEAIVTIL